MADVESGRVKLHANIANKRNRRLPNSATLKHWKFMVFETLNNSKLIWDLTHKPKGILCAHLNIQSILTKSDHVHHLLDDSNIEFLCLAKTWLCEFSPSAILSVPGYKMLRKDRQASKRGGVMIYAKNTFNCNEILFTNENGLEFLGLTVSLSQQMFFILVIIYRLLS